jgi:ABC-type transporter Mla MlaB component
MRIDLDEGTWPDQRIERVVFGPDVTIKYVAHAGLLFQEQRHFTQTLKHSMHEIRLFQRNFVLQFQRSRNRRLCSRDSSAPEMRVRQRDQSLFFVQVGDIKSEQGQDLVDIAFVNKTQAVELLQAWFGFPVFEVAYPIVRHIVCRIFLFLYDSLAESLVLDLAQVDRIDAGGLGVLLGLREWACSHAIRSQLMNVTDQVEHVLELTKLDRVLEFCSVEDMLQLLHFAAAIAPRSFDRANQRIMKDSVEGQDAPPAAQRDSLPTGTIVRSQEWAGVPADMQSAQTGALISNEGSASRQEYDSHC